eukprot:2007233-Alexandrium_andersonii.AAC.1
MALKMHGLHAFSSAKCASTFKGKSSTSEDRTHHASPVPAVSRQVLYHTRHASCGASHPE